jgi:hypothetical protein
MRSFFKIITLAILLFISTSDSYSQTDQSEQAPLKKNAISFSFLGSTPAIGFVYERVLSNKLTGEIGLGVVSAGAGVKYYP